MLPEPSKPAESWAKTWNCSRGYRAGDAEVDRGYYCELPPQPRPNREINRIKLGVLLALLEARLVDQMPLFGEPCLS
jgi:hypothetical protein